MWGHCWNRDSSLFTVGMQMKQKSFSLDTKPQCLCRRRVSMRTSWKLSVLAPLQGDFGFIYKSQEKAQPEVLWWPGQTVTWRAPGSQAGAPADHRGRAGAPFPRTLWVPPVNQKAHSQDALCCRCPFYLLRDTTPVSLIYTSFAGLWHSLRDSHPHTLFLRGLNSNLRFIPRLNFVSISDILYHSGVSLSVWGITRFWDKRNAIKNPDY